MKNIVWTGVLLLCVALPLRASDVPSDARREIKAANDAWIPALERQDAAAAAEPYADDAVFITAGGQTIVGRAGVEKLTRDRFTAGRVVGGTIVQDGLTMQGPFVFEWGHADLQLVKDGTKTQSHGRYLTVWRRDGSGRWRISRNLSFAD